MKVRLSARSMTANHQWMIILIALYAVVVLATLALASIIVSRAGR